jgi:hypothetical protein
MSRNIIFVLMYHRHKRLEFYELVMFLSSGKSTKSALFSAIDGAHPCLPILK